MQASAPHLIALKALVQTVSSSTTLKVNFAKSGMIPLNLDEDNALLLASTYGCSLLLASTYGCSLISLPFTYLGIPLSASKPKIGLVGIFFGRVKILQLD
uniref:Reverse transcriptase domain-containing protein n=1 Tax=Oryza glumipatula TaxID=40148 RepID=A0A0E0A9C6_9ORYZ